MTEDYANSQSYCVAAKNRHSIRFQWSQKTNFSFANQVNKLLILKQFQLGFDKLNVPLISNLNSLAIFQFNILCAAQTVYDECHSCRTEPPPYYCTITADADVAAYVR